MLTAVKAKLGLLEKKQQKQPALDFNNYIKQLISVYTNPLSRSRYDYSELIEIQKQKAATQLNERFQSDRVIILRLILAALLPDWDMNTPIVPDSIIEQSLQVLSYEQTSEQEIDRTTLINAIECLCECNPGEKYDKLSDRIGSILAEPVSIVFSKTSKHHNIEYNASSKKAKLLMLILDQLIEDGRIPRFLELDHLDDIVPIVESRYAGPKEKYWTRSSAMLATLSALSTGNPALPKQELPNALQVALGKNHPYIPKRGAAHENVRKMIPDLFDEFISLRAKNNPDRFLEINKEYSYRQRLIAGAKDNPWGIPLLGGFEQDHHLMLRTLLELRNNGALSQNDEVLVVGPRYPDELIFFRKHIDLPHTIGLDLFEDKENGIEARDMHNTGFASGRFGLIYCAGTLNYAYNIRQVIEEFARILKRPGYLILTDNGDRVNGVDPLGRSDPANADTLIGLFYKHQTVVLAQDNGKTPFPSMFNCWPCVALEILA